MLEVIGVGFGRTGTGSLKAALNQLGLGPCHHMSELLRQIPERAADWTAVLDGAEPDFERLYAGYRSTVDWPGATYWRELVEAYPQAKVILTVRDPDAWYTSADRSIGWMLRGSVSRPRRLVLWYRLAAMYGTSWRTRWGLRHWGPMTKRLLWERQFGGRFDDRAHTTDVHRRHVRAVLEHVPADRLLVYEVAQGWQPLCEFLGVDVPDEPFPLVNQGDEFRARQRRLLVRGSRVPAAVLATLVALLLLALFGPW
ncbi:MAG TPA: sulfotransferase [Micromonospora sp.]